MAKTKHISVENNQLEAAITILEDAEGYYMVHKETPSDPDLIIFTSDRTLKDAAQDDALRYNGTEYARLHVFLYALAQRGLNVRFELV